MENKRLFNIVSTILALSKKKKKEFYDYLVSRDEILKKLEDKDKYEEALKVPLTFEIKSDGVICWKTSNANYTKTIQYSKNDDVWTNITSTTDGVNINVVSGDIVQFRGDNTEYCSDSKYNGFNGTTATFKVKGNIMSLLNRADFYNIKTLNTNDTFSFLFKDCNTLIDASELLLPAIKLSYECYNGMFLMCNELIAAPKLPATILAESCYSSMFQRCEKLIIAPELPATTLDLYCYYNMFLGCWELTEAPKLPAKVLKTGCYEGMFSGCRSLTKAPELPAPTLVNSCYQSMFQWCTLLSYIKCLAIETTAGNCLNYWVSEISSSGTFVKSSEASFWENGVDGIPNGWTVQDA